MANVYHPWRRLPIRLKTTSLTGTSGDIKITYGIAASPFGYCVLGLTSHGICTLSFLDTNTQSEAVRTIYETWPGAILTRDDKGIQPYVQQLFDPATVTQPITLFVHGTDFQIKVWKALLAIPQGKTSSYAKIARVVGSPKAVRAVGSACGKNPIGFLIPCHRVLTSQGELGGYHWGVKRKQAILTWEQMRGK